MGEHERLPAMLAELAEGFSADARELAELDDERTRVLAGEGLPTPGEMAADLRTMAYRVETLQRLQAEAGRAHAVMVAAGGRENAQAYAEYEETMARLSALLPDFDKGDLGR